jgi:DNA uptake protein ComE-like DNA-binding protein
MGIYDRDYMRDDYVPANRRGKNPQKSRSRNTFLLVDLALVALGIGAIVFVSLRKAADDSEFFTDSESTGVAPVEYPIDVNTATFTELVTVPQIGLATAEQIISNRPFEKLEDLLKIYGVGEAKLKVFSRYLRIDRPLSPVEESDSVDPTNF